MQQTNLFFALGSLLILVLLLASGVRRYQEMMAERRLRIKRLLRGVDLIREMLSALGGYPLPVELERLLLEDVLARFQRVRQIDSRFQGIDELVAEAERSVNPIGKPRKFEIQDTRQLHGIIKPLGELIDFFGSGGVLASLSADQVARIVKQIGELRAEAVYRFHTQEARRLLGSDESKRAIRHCGSIKSFLSQYGPATQQVKTWYEETETLQSELEAAIDDSAPAA